MVSDPEHAEAYGLTDAGREQVRAGVERARLKGLLEGRCRVVTSPLRRAQETARIAADLLAAEVRTDPRLAERGFGELELGSDARYRAVWKADAADPDHTEFGVESVRAVERRVQALVRALEEETVAEGASEDGPGEAVLLSTHGDVASILYCSALGEPLERHRVVGGLANAELRALPGSPDQWWPRTGRGG